MEVHWLGWVMIGLVPAVAAFGLWWDYRNDVQGRTGI